jgi:hypothetical protein
MSEGGEPSAPATPGLLLLSYTTPRDAACQVAGLGTREQAFVALRTVIGGSVYGNRVLPWLQLAAVVICSKNGAGALHTRIRQFSVGRAEIRCR